MLFKDGIKCEFLREDLLTWATRSQLGCHDDGGPAGLLSGWLDDLRPLRPGPGRDPRQRAPPAAAQGVDVGHRAGVPSQRARPHAGGPGDGPAQRE